MSGLSGARWIREQRSFYRHGLSLIPAWISNHVPNKVWDEITYPFPNINGATVEVWEWMNNSPYILWRVWLLIHAEIKVKPCYRRGAQNEGSKCETGTNKHYGKWKEINKHEIYHQNCNVMYRKFLLNDNHIRSKAVWYLCWVDLWGNDNGKRRKKIEWQFQYCRIIGWFGKNWNADHPISSLFNIVFRYHFQWWQHRLFLWKRSQFPKIIIKHMLNMPTVVLFLCGITGQFLMDPFDTFIVITISWVSWR